MKVKEVMSKTLYCCTPTDTIQKAAELMKDNDVGAIPVVNDCKERKLLGIITDRDICVKVASTGKSTVAVKVGEVMSKSPTTCKPDDTLEACEMKMEQKQVRRIPVVDASGKCVGLVAQADIALRDTPLHIHHTLAAISQHHAHPQAAAQA